MLARAAPSFAAFYLGVGLYLRIGLSEAAEVAFVPLQKTKGGFI